MIIDPVLLQQVINGLSLGAMYALLALGFTLVYGILELINFAHFNVFMVGSFIGLWTLQAMGINGQSVILTGRSGSGKSTLFRALAGIWPFGQGQVQRPAERCLFLPQRPYIPLGTLRHVVTYPLPAERFSRDAIAKALEDAGLPGLVPQLDREENWALQLSGGEQQRVALARALLAKPDWLFLDEATASLDPEAEAQLYQTLKTRLPHTTLISIAHRPSVAEFHERRLVLQREGDKPGTVVPGDLAPANGGGG